MKNKKYTLVLGASKKKERYAYKATESLKNAGYSVVLLARRADEVLGEKIYASVDDIARRLDEEGGEVDTITLYLGPQNQTELLTICDRLKPRRVIFNPGTENQEMYEEVKKKGIKVEEACTLVLLSLNNY